MSQMIYAIVALAAVTLHSVSIRSSSVGSSSLGETHWDSIIRPTALARNDYQDYVEV